MKIGQPTDKPPGVAASAATPSTAEMAARSSKTAAPAAADPSAHVELSSTAATLLSGGTAAEFDADKVARFSDAIASGTYQVDPAAIADKLIANAQELLSKVKG